MFKPVQRGLSGQHSAIAAARFSLSRNKVQHGIMALFMRSSSAPLKSDR
jgi:hypothetical protein